MTQFTFRNPAGEFERFAPSVADSMVGKTVPVDVEGAPLAHGEIVAVVVAPDGSFLDITIDVGDVEFPRMVGLGPGWGTGSFSIARGSDRGSNLSESGVAEDARNGPAGPSGT